MASMSIQSKLILAFVTLILGAVLIGTIATNGLLVTEKTGKINDSIAVPTEGYDGDTESGSMNITYVYTVSQPPTGWKVTDCPLTSVVLKNGNGTGSLYVVSTDYVFYAANGTFKLRDTLKVNKTLATGGGNATFVDYLYCGNDYMNIGWGRTIINLVAGFFALAILGASIGLFWSVAKDTGMM